MNDQYLKTSAMKATSSSMSLASSVLGFEVVELWSDEGDGRIHCTYVHAEENFIKRYPDIITGHYPNHRRKHVLSPMLCELARNAKSNYHWNVIEDSSENVINRSAYTDVVFPVKTEMSYLLNGDTGGSFVFIVGLSTEVVEFKESKLKFLSGLGYAIYVAAFDLDDEEEENTDSKELDTKEFLPRPIISSNSIMNLAGIGSNINLASLAANLPSAKHSFGNLNSNLYTVAEMRSRTNSNVSLNQPGMYITDSPKATTSSKKSSLETESSPIAKAEMCLNESDEVHESEPTKLNSKSSESPRRVTFPPTLTQDIVIPPADRKDDTEVKIDLIDPTPVQGESTYYLPTWEPVAPFNFPVAQIPIRIEIFDDLTFTSFSEMTHIADGSNANVFLAKFRGEKVVIKMIKAEVQYDTVAVHEFDLEHGMLARVAHPNIIKVLGSGRAPRRFIVLEWLGGGSLNSLLALHQAKPGLAQRLFRRPSFTYSQLLERARDMAEALDYLHFRCHVGATIIHRDLKPDNVGFTADGQLKLFDFGLVTCVRSRQDSSAAYEMTGYTGSLRYMAPEVALRLPYSEKVDVYSYGIMVWQMARDRVPFKGLNKEEFLRTVVKGGMRPKLDRSWPKGFSDLLTRCWDREPTNRPSFAMVIIELNQLITATGGSVDWSKRGRNSIRMDSSNGKNAHSTWF
eukprot:CAMPEP_0170075316 /NCGR_PEP_ID=MMETSP0019_2-20121128/12469_1 /TAXON_ID=98059 /ORGANISM="Dinobryon sp., Strain UTEXLB2267" /LENGTH=683 /DNA_ID=CAMNT_0010286195 /DNA_START=86 /DNA_END=2137 /DNA_ORIENTATION=-